MATIVIRIDMPTGIDVTGGGTSLSDAEMEALQKERQEFQDLIGPYLAGLPERPPRRAGNVHRVELLGATTLPDLNRYLALISVDIGNPDFAGELKELLPPKAEISVIGDYGRLQAWPEDA